MLDIKLDELIKVLGQPTKCTGHQYYFRCPSCASLGGDNSGDNLLFNEYKGVLKCFACEDGAKEALKLVNKWRKNNDIKSYAPTVINDVGRSFKMWWENNEQNLWQYWIEAHEEMSTKALRWLDSCGIGKDVVDEWMLGYDNNPTILKIGPCVAFPMISLNHNERLVGFELRQVGKEKVIRHTYDAPKCLCIIADNKDATKLVICEGFKDAYSFWQIVNNKNIQNEYTILTPAHGVDDIIDNLKDVNFTRYKKCYLLLDNDAAGNRVTDKIIDKYPFFKDQRKILKQYKDVNELWMGEYVKAERVSIENAK